MSKESKVKVSRVSTGSKVSKVTIKIKMLILHILMSETFTAQVFPLHAFEF